MRAISLGFADSPLKFDLEDRIEHAHRNKMRFWVRSPRNDDEGDLVPIYFPEHTRPQPLPDIPALSPWPWDLFTDPFVDIATCVDSQRASYLAPCIHFNSYLDWLLFDQECEQGRHDFWQGDECAQSRGNGKEKKKKHAKKKKKKHAKKKKKFARAPEQQRPSNIARRTHIEVSAHAVLISLKSALDRLVSVAAYYFPGVMAHMTWGRVENGKAKNFMSVVEQGRDTDELLAFFHEEYTRWIAEMVAPRDEVIHYEDLQTGWTFRYNEETEEGELTPFHASSRDRESTAFDVNILATYVNAYYALADRTLLTLALRTPLAITKLAPAPRSTLGDAIMRAFQLPPSARVGQLRKAIEQAISAGEVPANEPPEVYVQFLRQNASRLGLDLGGQT